MDKIVLIGSFNSAVKRLNETLSVFAKVQLCASNEDVAADMLDMIGPDLTVVHLSADAAANGKLFTMIQRRFSAIPTVALGTRAEIEDLKLRNTWVNSHVRFLESSMSPADVAKHARDILNTGVARPKGVGEIELMTPPDDRRTILVVDDSPMLLRTMEAMLRKKYKVTFALSASKAMDAIYKQKPDLILLDYNMPQVDGRMALERLRSEEETKDIPVIFLTGVSKRDQVESVLPLEPEGYLLKPPSEERVFAEIESVLREHDEKMKKQKAGD